MTTTLFLQSEVQDSYQLYERMLSEAPVYWDASANHWAIYSYEDCKTVLGNPAAQIPPINKEGLNGYALAIINRLARLSNNAEHEIARQAAMLLFEKMQTISIAGIIKTLIEEENSNGQIDWVTAISRKLPVMTVLESFGFNKEDIRFITTQMGNLVKIMLPNRTKEEVAVINEVSKEVHIITKRHFLGSKFYRSAVNTFSEKYQMPIDEVVSLHVSNLVGLFIQSYDATRGVLSNALLQILINNPSPDLADIGFLQKSVIETLRYDPPVHNTRRVATDAITLGEHQIKKGESLFIVLAAANRDHRKFTDPGIYNIHRSNNAEYLSFGAGHHSCVAKHFSVNLATDALTYLFDTYPSVQLLETNIQYEPAINVRLPKKLMISLLN